MKTRKKYEIIDGHKECSICSQLLELKMFYPTYKGEKIYYSKKCRKCTRIYLLNKEGFKICKACGEEKHYSQFRPNKETYDTLCKPCRNDHRKNLYHTNEEFRKKHNLNVSRRQKEVRPLRTLQNKLWKLKNPDRAEKWRLDYLAKARENNKKYQQRNPEKIKQKRDINNAYYKDTIHDIYVNQIIKRKTNIEYVPVELTRLKRLQIKCKRILKLKENESHRITQPTIKSPN